ncbi:MAG: hypothetical protein Kow0059_16590 [Candidatus Sumerlaeia bacterium]
MTDRSRIYTNVILTVIAVLLAILAFRPANPILPEAQAQILNPRERNEQQITAFSDTYLKAADTIAAALREIAGANADMAKALNKIGDDLRYVGGKVDALARAQQNRPSE